MIRKEKRPIHTPASYRVCASLGIFKSQALLFVSVSFFFLCLELYTVSPKPFSTSFLAQSRIMAFLTIYSQKIQKKNIHVFRTQRLNRIPAAKRSLSRVPLTLWLNEAILTQFFAHAKMLDRGVGAVQSRPQRLRYFCPADGATIAVAVQKDRGLLERDWVQCGHFDHELAFWQWYRGPCFSCIHTRVRTFTYGKHSLAFFGHYLSWNEW